MRVGVRTAFAAVCSPRSVASDGRALGRVLAVMVMERLADFVSKSLEGGEAPAPPPEPGDAEDPDEEVDITALEEKAPPVKRPRNWLLSPVPVQSCKREADDEDGTKLGEFSYGHRFIMK